MSEVAPPAAARPGFAPFGALGAQAQRAAPATTTAATAATSQLFRCRSIIVSLLAARTLRPFSMRPLHARRAAAARLLFLAALVLGEGGPEVPDRLLLLFG